MTSASTYAFRRCLGRKPTADEVRELLGLLERQKSALAEGWVNPSRTGDRQKRDARKLAQRRDADATGRLHRRLARAAESGRNNHEGIDYELPILELYRERGQHPQVDLRAAGFFKQCGVGLGAIALRKSAR